jgi:hypothetical protein
MREENMKAMPRPRFVRDTISEEVRTGVPAMVRAVYGDRSGRCRPPVPDDVIRGEVLGAIRECVRRRDREAGPSGWMAAESRWASQVRILDEALAHPDADPRIMAHAAAANSLAAIRYAAAECLPGSTRGAFLDAMRAVAEMHVGRLVVHGCHPGPVFAEAFVGRFLEIAEHEMPGVPG